ncbi:CHAT domain-containing protein [Streptomyces sp. NPDC005963]|uniref:CHAT domain-containing protein n=1 Tax=Streptomyces sp. NPDC005963 TaxID=3156721 RepID=UPI0033CAAB4B
MGNEAKAAVARRIARYLGRNDDTGLGPDADADIARMIQAARAQGDTQGVTGEPEAMWLALWLVLCRCTAPGRPDLRAPRLMTAAEGVLRVLNGMRPSLVVPGTHEAVAGRGPLPEDHRLWAAVAGALLQDGLPGDLREAAAAVDRYRIGAVGQGGVTTPVALSLGELLATKLAEAEFESADPARAGLAVSASESSMGNGHTAGDSRVGWEAAAAVLEAGIAPLVPGSAPRLAALDTLGRALGVLSGLDPQDQFVYRPVDDRAAACLSRALEVLWEAIAFLPEHERAVLARVQIADLLLHRHVNGSPHGDHESLGKAITQQGRAARLAEQLNMAGVGGLYVGLANLLGHRALLLGRSEDHAGALEAARRAEVLTGKGAPERSRVLYCLGQVELGCFDHFGDAPMLDSAVMHLRNACTAVGHPFGDDASTLQVLAEALLVRHEAGSRSPDATVGVRLFGATTDIDEARACAEVVMASYPSSPDDFGRLCVLSSIYLAAYQETSDPVLLDAAVLAAELTASVPPDHPSAAECHGRRACALAERHRLRPVVDGGGDLAEAIREARIAVVVAPEPAQSLYLHNLATLLALRLQTVQSKQDVRDLLALHEDVVAATPIDSRHLPGRLHGQQAALRTAAKILNDPGLLSEAVAIAARACELSDRDNPFRPMLRTGHALALCERAQAVLGMTTPPEGHPPTGTDTIVDDSRILRSTTADPPQVLKDAEPTARARADLAEAIRIASLVREDTPTGSPAEDWALTVLIRALVAQARADKGGSALSAPEADAPETTLSRVVELIDQALTPSDDLTRSPRRSELLLLRAQALLMAAEQHPGGRPDATDQNRPSTSEPTSTTRALADLDEVAQADHARLPDRLVAAERSARLVMDLGDAAGAHRRYRLALDLLRRWIAVGLSANDARTLLGDWRMLGADAAAAAMADGNPTSALAQLEDNRAILWRRVLELRTDLDRVHDLDPALATRLRMSAAVLRTASLEAFPSTGPAPEEQRGHRALRLPSPNTQRLHDAELAWSAAVDDARQLIPGFLERPDPMALCAGLPGPVVVVNISRHRCDALLVDPRGVRTLPLRLRLEDVQRHAAAYLAAARTFEERASTSAAPLGVGVTGPFNRVLGTVTGWLWEAVASPVLDALPLAGSEEGELRPRLWWCPTGPLALLPLHAAGRHTAPGESVIERVVPSYTPTVAALAASAGAVVHPSQSRMLAVLADRVDGTAELPGADTQNALITERFPDATVLRRGRARSEQLLEQLATHTLLHVMCHGLHDPHRPERSGLLMEDGVVPIAALAAERTDAAFASLTACQTATLDPLTSDEVISVAGAMVFAGWRQTVATLWPVDAAETTAVTALLYGAGSAPGASPTAGPGTPTALPTEANPFDPDQAARRLHAAVLSRRSLTRAPQARLWAWGAYLHIGV